MRAYGLSVSLRKLFSVLVAVAVLFAPALTRAGEVYAAVPDHPVQMMDSGHCESLPGDDQDDSTTKSCCIAMCMALAVAPPTPASARPPRSGDTPSFVPSSYRGYLAEIATPPPRLA